MDNVPNLIYFVDTKNKTSRHVDFDIEVKFLIRFYFITLSTLSVMSAGF